MIFNNYVSKDIILNEAVLLYELSSKLNFHDESLLSVYSIQLLKCSIDGLGCSNMMTFLESYSTNKLYVRMYVFLLMKKKYICHKNT